MENTTMLISVLNSQYKPLNLVFKVNDIPTSTKFNYIDYGHTEFSLFDKIRLSDEGVSNIIDFMEKISFVESVDINNDNSIFIVYYK